jgi:hypothetical protein
MSFIRSLHVRALALITVVVGLGAAGCTKDLAMFANAADCGEACYTYNHCWSTSYDVDECAENCVLGNVSSADLDACEACMNDTQCTGSEDAFNCDDECGAVLQ